jgi:hypothetical protein
VTRTSACGSLHTFIVEIDKSTKQDEGFPIVRNAQRLLELLVSSDSCETLYWKAQRLIQIFQMQVKGKASACEAGCDARLEFCLILDFWGHDWNSYHRLRPYLTATQDVL